MDGVLLGFSPKHWQSQWHPVWVSRTGCGDVRFWDNRAVVNEHPLSIPIIHPMHEAIERDGYEIIPAVFSAEEVEMLRESCAAALAADSDSVLANGGPAYGARNLLTLWPEAIRWARAPQTANRLRDLLGEQAGLVRGLYFDKPPGHSWSLPWHRDLTIAVKAHGGSEVFRKHTTKAGVPHVEAPFEVLSNMLTMRIHLDAMSAENGPLCVVLGSHRAEASDETSHMVELHCAAGDVLFMRPFLLHASGRSRSGASHRRVIHLECAASPHLADGYEWHTFVPLNAD